MGVMTDEQFERVVEDAVEVVDRLQAACEEHARTGCSYQKIVAARVAVLAAILMEGARQEARPAI